MALYPYCYLLPCMKKASALTLALLVGATCFVVGYWFGTPTRSENEVAALQALMGWDTAQATQYIELMHGQTTPEEIAEMMAYVRDYSQKALWSLENNTLLTTFNLIMILNWLEQGDIEGIKEYSVGRIVSVYNEPIESFHPDLREAHVGMQQKVEELALKMPELQKALADSATEK